MMNQLARMQAQTQRDFLRAMAKKRTDAESADFTIISHGKEYKVHKFVLSLHSKYFDKLFQSEYKEAVQNRIELVDDPQSAVSCMIQYCYHFSYKPEPSTYVEPTPSISSALTLVGVEYATSPWPTLLQVHATVYTLAEKYDIPGLKPLAKANFTSTAHNSLRWKSHHAPQAAQMQALYDVIPYIYTNTAPNEMGLRSSVVEIWGKARRFVHDAADWDTWQRLVERFPDLGADMITGLVNVVGLDDDEYDKESYCGGFVDDDDDDGKGDLTAYEGWGREENDDDRSDEAMNGSDNSN